ncbi:cilium assembly protein DZIP1L [Rhynchocyon petersi]
MQSPMPTTEGLCSLLFGAYTLPVFKFQPRRERVDWRRISSLDMERVVREIDVATLQENLSSVTFCNLDRETCSYCGQPVDPVLLKVLRLAQLIIEYLLHCQDCLRASIVQLEAQLKASMGQHERGQQELGRQADELKGVREESRRRRKMISTLQQLLLQTGIHSYHMCHLCDKAFMNTTFLRAHMQRRHADLAEGGKQKKQEQSVKEVLKELQAKLKWTQDELEAQRKAERQWQLQEAEMIHQREMEDKRKFEEWEKKEKIKFYEEIDKLKQLFCEEFKRVANQNSTLEEKLQTLQSYSMIESNLGSLKDEESEERLKQAQELHALMEKMEIQKVEWKRRMKELQEEHVAQKRELQQENERLQASLSQDQKKAASQAQNQINALRTQLQEQAKLIASQEEKMRSMSLRKVEELESSQKEQQVMAAMRLNPALLKQFRPILEDTLEEKLGSMGIQRDAKGISVQMFRHLETLLRAQREQKSARFSEFLSLRGKFIKETTSRVKERQKNRAVVAQSDGKAPAPALPLTLAPGVNITKVFLILVEGENLSMRTLECLDIMLQATLRRRLCVDLEDRYGRLGPSGDTKAFLQGSNGYSLGGPKPVESIDHQRNPANSQQLAHTPTLQARVQGFSNSPASPGPLLSTPPFSSEEDLEGYAVQCASHHEPQIPFKMGSRPKDDWDWSDTETLRGNDHPPGKGSGTLVQSMVRSLEKQLEAPVKKPVGGVSLFLLPKTGSQPAATQGWKPQLSEDESDLEISSLEDFPQDLDQEKPKPSSHSKLPEKSGAPWSSIQSTVSGW